MIFFPPFFFPGTYSPTAEQRHETVCPTTFHTIPAYGNIPPQPDSVESQLSKAGVHVAAAQSSLAGNKAIAQASQLTALRPSTHTASFSTLARSIPTDLTLT